MPSLGGVLGGVLGGALIPLRPVVGVSSGADPAYAVTGPSTGVALAESTNFTVTGYNLTGPVIVTPASDDPGGTFTPSTVTIDVGSEVQTFTYTPDGSLGTHNLSWTNNGGLSNPAGIAYAVTATAYETEYQAVLDRATTLGYSLPSDAQKTAQNTLVASLKTAGIWAKLDVLYLFRNSPNSSFATLNFIAPASHQITIVNAMTFASDSGFAGNGTDAYLDTNYNSATQGVNFTQNNACRGAWIHTDGGTFIDGKAANNTSVMNSTSTTSQRINQSTNNCASAIDFSGTGMKCLNRTSSTNVEGFNNTTQTSTTATSAAQSSVNQLIFRSNTGYVAHVISAYWNGASLVAENTDLYNALNAYLSAI